MITAKGIAAPFGWLLLLTLLIGGGYPITVSAVASDTRLAVTIENGMVSLEAHAVPIDKIVNQIITETGAQIFVVGDLGADEFTGTFDNVALDAALRRVLKNRNHAIVFLGGRTSGSGQPGLVVMQDAGTHRKGVNPANMAAVKKGPAGSGHHSLAANRQEGGGAVTHGSEPMRPPATQIGHGATTTAGIKTTTISQPEDAKTTEGQIDAASTAPYDELGSDGDSIAATANSLEERQAWLVRMIEMTQANIDSGYADRRYANDVAECGENNVMHASEYLKYYQEKLDQLQTQL